MFGLVVFGEERVNALDIMLSQCVAWREVDMSLCVLLHQAISRSDTRCIVRGYTCVNSVKLPVCAFIEVYAEGTQGRTHGK